MKIFISYSLQDKIYADKITLAVKNAGHKIMDNSEWQAESNNIIKKINNKINDKIKLADVLILIISQNSLNSKWVKQEFFAMAFNMSQDKKKIVPVVIDDSSIPSYFANYIYFDLSRDFDNGINSILSTLTKFQATDNTETEDLMKGKTQNYEKEVNLLNDVLKSGRLTLVCGAGVSIQAGIPSWNHLLIKLLESMIKKISDKFKFKLDGNNVNEFWHRNSYSSLIIGKYLKNNLGTDFIPELRKALYSNSKQKCEIINAIADLARPQRHGNSIDSIITFNFDSLIEENLLDNNIKFKSIYDEGMNFNSEELPVYHVHGFIPMKGTLPDNCNVVFSEDTYHSQFIDSFSWSNLIQLTKLSQNTCLFIGLSLTDPNLRRLLDVAKRKNPEKSSHYIIKKRPENCKIDDPVDNLTLFLEEQDANELGLNVIWVDDFNDIAKVLNSICG